MEPRWTPVGREAEWAEGQARVVQVGARRIAVWRLADGWRALKDGCPHQGISLAAGRVQDGAVACPAHGWLFHLGDGRCLRGEPNRHAVAYPVRLREGAVEVGV